MSKIFTLVINRLLTINPMKYVAKNLKYLRNKKGLNQTEFSKEMGWTRGRLANYETGSPISVDILIKLGEYFNVKESDLLHTDLSLGDYELPIKEDMVTENQTPYENDLISILKKQIETLENDKAYFMSMLGKCLKGELKELPNVG